MTNGIIYIATGEKYIAEALKSAATARKHMPDIPVTLISDRPVSSELIEQTIIVDDPSYTFRDKVAYMKLAPYKKTLFLDTDTYICAPVYELFVALDRFDIGLVHDSGFISISFPEVPESFPQFNSGVMAFRQSLEMREVLRQWLTRYESLRILFEESDRRQTGWTVDEASLRALLYESSVQITPLTPQYNCRFIEGGYVAGTVKILHRHSTHEYETVAKIINAYSGQRVYVGHQVLRHKVVGRFFQRDAVIRIGSYHKPFIRLLAERSVKYLRQYGLVGTLRQMIGRIVGSNRIG